MAATLWADFEHGTNGATITTASGEASATAWTFVGTSPAYSNTHVAHGSLAATNPGTDGNHLSWENLMTATTDHYGRLYFYATANPGARLNLVKFDQTGSGTKGYIAVDSSGKVVAIDNLAGHTQTSSASIPLNQWFRIEWHAVISATVGQMEVRLFSSPDSTTPTETITTPANWDLGVATNTLHFLDLDGTWGSSIWIDDIVGNALTWPGPADRVLTATFDQGSNGADIQVTDVGDASQWDERNVNAFVTYDSSPALGTNSAHFETTGGAGAAHLRWTSSFGTQTEYYGRCCFYRLAFPALDTTHVRHERFISTLVSWDLIITTTGKILIANQAAGTIATSTSTIPLGSWFRVEWYVNNTTGGMEIRYYADANSTSLTETVVSGTPGGLGADSQTADFGLQALSQEMWLDAIVDNASDWPGPPTPVVQVLSMQSHVFGHNMW